MKKNYRLRKRYQRNFTKLVRKYNKAIEDDDLWQGRFVCRQIYSHWENFDDGSGGILHTVIRCVDKQTRQYKDFTFEYADWIRTFHWHFSMDILNKFIVEDIDAWRTGNPKEEKQDWTEIEIPNSVFQNNKIKEMNFYGLTKY